MFASRLAKAKSKDEKEVFERLGRVFELKQTPLTKLFDYRNTLKSSLL
jgi:hypothetical protein